MYIFSVSLTTACTDQSCGQSGGFIIFSNVFRVYEHVLCLYVLMFKSWFSCYLMKREVHLEVNLV